MKKLLLALAMLLTSATAVFAQDPVKINVTTTTASTVIQDGVYLLRNSGPGVVQWECNSTTVSLTNGSTLVVGATVRVQSGCKRLAYKSTSTSQLRYWVGQNDTEGWSGYGVSETVYQPHFVSTRKFGYAAPITNSQSTLTAVGFSTLTVTGTASSQPALTGATRNFVQWATAATNGTVAGYASGVTGTFNNTRPLYRPRLSVLTHTDSTVTLRRQCYGITESALDALAITQASTASAIDFVAVCFDTAVDSAWQCCSGDGTNESCEDITGSTVAVNTEYVVLVDWTTAGHLVCTVQPVGSPAITVDRTTLLSTGAVDMAPYMSVTTLADAAVNMQISKYMLTMN